MHRRRGIVRASITRLATRLSEYEGKTDQPSTLDHAHRMSQRLNDLDSEFKCHHYGVVDLIDDEEGVLRYWMNMMTMFSYCPLELNI